MDLQFDKLSEVIIDNHCYSSWLLNGNWQKEITETYKKLRTDTRFPIKPICLDGIEFSIESIKKRIENNTFPERKGGNFCVVRSDFGEVLSYIVLEQLHHTKFGYKSVRDRELINLPGRGIDGIGIEYGEKIKLVFSETKVSGETTSPPSVVDRNEDSLRNQHLAHIHDENTCRKVWDIARKATDSELQELFLKAAICFEEKLVDLLDVITCCIMVRPKCIHTSNDFGSFKSAPEDYHPGKIRFIVLCLPESCGQNVECVIDTWYQQIHEGRFETIE